MTALADFIRTVFNTSQSAAPKLAPAHLGYRVHVHMEKNKAGCLLHGSAANWMLPTLYSRVYSSSSSMQQGSKKQLSTVLETREDECLLGHTPHDAVTRSHHGLAVHPHC